MNDYWFSVPKTPVQVQVQVQVQVELDPGLDNVQVQVQVQVQVREAVRVAYYVWTLWFRTSDAEDPSWWYGGELGGGGQGEGNEG